MPLRWALAAPALVTVIQCLLLLMGNCFTYLWEIVSPTYGKLFQTSVRTPTNVFTSDANLFSNLVTIDLLSELYLMVPLLLLVTNSNRLIRYWITATGAGVEPTVAWGIVRWGVPPRRPR